MPASNILLATVGLYSRTLGTIAERNIYVSDLKSIPLGARNLKGLGLNDTFPISDSGIPTILPDQFRIVEVMGERSTFVPDLEARVIYHDAYRVFVGQIDFRFVPGMGRIEPLPGCKDKDAFNYNPFATQSDGSCTSKDRRVIFINTDQDSAHNFTLLYGFGDADDQYLVGDWDGDGRDNIGVRRGRELFLDTNFDAYADIIFTYGFGNADDQYLVGDWDGDGRDNIAVRRGRELFLDTNFDPSAEIIFTYGFGNADDQYFAGDWDGDGRDNIAVRRGRELFLDTNFDPSAEIIFTYGFGNADDQYFAGDWDGNGRDDIGVRRGTTLFLDYNRDPSADLVFSYGLPSDAAWLFGDFDGDGIDNVAVRR
jgi:hypothetical protein